jgi:hypothetical protein
VLPLLPARNSKQSVRPDTSSRAKRLHVDSRNDGYPVNSTIRITALPVVSDLLSDLFRQLQISGLLFAHHDLLQPEAGEAVLSHLWTRWDILFEIATMLESYMPGAVVISDTPCISNTVRWNPKQLGGYAATDINLSLSDLLSSYRGCWRHAIMYPPFTFTRFTRLGFWYWRERNDVFAGLGLLLDLYRAGFFLRMKDLGSAIAPICCAFTTGFEPAEFFKRDFTSQDVDDAIVEIAAEAFNKPHSKNRAQMLIDWMGDQAIEDVSTAHAASTLDQWLVANARVYITTDALTSFGKIHNEQLSVTQRVLVSQFEEIRADMGGAVASERARGRDGSPFLFDISVYGVALQYQEIYKTDWVEKMAEDRVLIPYPLRDNVRTAYTNVEPFSVARVDIPKEWKRHSEMIGWSLCAIFRRNPNNECSVEFTDDAVSSCCRALGHLPEDGASGKAPGDFGWRGQAEARAELSRSLFHQLSGNENLIGSDTIGGLERMQQAYPWHPRLLRKLGVQHAHAGNPMKAFSLMRSALLLDASNAATWKALAMILRQLNNPIEAKVIESIGKTFEVTR